MATWLAKERRLAEARAQLTNPALQPVRPKQA